MHIYEQTVIGMTAPNPYLLHYFLWKHHFWFMPTFSETQLQYRPIFTLENGTYRLSQNVGN